MTLTGGATDVWIFQIAQGLNLGNAAIITLAEGAKATTLGTTSQMKGIVLCQTLIEVKTGASVRLYAQTKITLESNAITQP